jgi:hypothetical protein
MRCTKQNTFGSFCNPATAFRKGGLMIWINGETWKSKIERKERWHKWFAWFPVTVGEVSIKGKTRHTKIWLEYVQRKGEYFSYYDDSFWIWKYRELLKEEI